MLPRKAIEQDITNKAAISCGIDELIIRTGLGMNSAKKLAEKAGAKFKFGRRTLYNLKKIDAYIDKLSESEAV
jgi:hypothetical protein